VLGIAPPVAVAALALCLALGLAAKWVALRARLDRRLLSMLADAGAVLGIAPHSGCSMRR